MPRFYFDVFDGREAVRDDFGMEQDSSEDAAEQAAALLADLARDMLPNQQSHDFAALVRDEDGSAIYRVLLLFRGQWPNENKPRYPVEVDSRDRIIERSKILLQEADSLCERLTAGVHSLLLAMQDVKSTLKDSRTLVRDPGSKRFV